MSVRRWMEWRGLGIRVWLRCGVRHGSGWWRVHAVDVEKLEVSETTTPALMDFLLFTHAIARATLYGTFER